MPSLFSWSSLAELSLSCSCGYYHCLNDNFTGSHILSSHTPIIIHWFTWVEKEAKIFDIVGSFIKQNHLRTYDTNESTHLKSGCTSHSYAFRTFRSFLLNKTVPHYVVELIAHVASYFSPCFQFSHVMHW